MANINDEFADPDSILIWADDGAIHVNAYYFSGGARSISLTLNQKNRARLRAALDEIDSMEGAK